jgi:hypothetical protein
VNDPQFVDEDQYMEHQNEQNWTTYTGAGYNEDYAVNTAQHPTGYVAWGYPYCAAPWGYQEMFVTWVADEGLDTDVQYRVYYAGGTSGPVVVSQRDEPPDDYPEEALHWKSLGVWDGAQTVDANWGGIRGTRTDIDILEKIL